MGARFRFSATLPTMVRLKQSGLRHKLRKVTVCLVAAVLLLYPLDWLVWRVRSATGTGMGTATVTSTTAATLKGNRFEIYSQNSTEVNCSESILPEAGAGACWWLRRHPQAIMQY